MATLDINKETETENGVYMQDNFFDLSGYVYSRKTGFAFCTQMEQCYNDSAHLICKTSKKMQTN